MRKPPFRRLFLSFVAVAAIACGDEGTTPVDPGPLPLGTGQWFLNAFDGDSALGSTIATRSVGVAQERTALDSASLFINANGSYEQRYWLRIFIAGALDRSETVIDVGTWGTVGPDFVFTSTVRTRTFTIVPALGERLRSAEQMVYWDGAPTTAGIYRRTRP